MSQFRFEIHHIMSALVLFVLVSATVAAQINASPQQQDIHRRSDLDELWMTFKTTHNKRYSDDIEDSYRRSVWQDNVDYIQKHNIEADLGLHTYTLGVNEHADLTLTEYSKLLLGTRVPPSFNVSKDVMDEEYYKLDDSLPSSVDWRTKGYVTPVKNQGQCGSCWAFSSTGSLEGQTFRKTGRLISLSEQNLVDCSRNYGNQGCNGGWMMSAFKYVIANRGIDTQTSYPYEARDSSCRYKSSGVGTKCTGYTSIANSETALQTAVANVGPISVAIDANHRSFHLYSSGVYYEPACTKQIDHAVLVVGYGTYGGRDYWLVKNSWGTTWGSGGYIMMSRNMGNQCAIASYGIYPTV